MVDATPDKVVIGRIVQDYKGPTAERSFGDEVRRSPDRIG